MVAPRIVLSKREESTAARAAFSALFSPSPSPNPKMASPESNRRDFISAKSKFMRPLAKIRSVIPLTAVNRTKLLFLKAS